MENIYVVSAVSFDCVLFAKAAAAVFERGKDCCWVVMQADVFLMLFEFCFIQTFNYSSSQMPTHFCCCTSQFWQTLNNISKSIDIINVCSFYLILSSFYLFAGSCLNSYLFQIESVCSCLSSNCKQHSVKLFRRFYFIRLLILYNDLKLAILFLCNTLW